MTLFSVILLGLVLRFWQCLRNKPQFHILFIEHKKGQRQLNDKLYLDHFARVLIPSISITTGLSIFILFDYNVISSGLHTCYFHYLFTDIGRFYLSALMYSLIIGASVSVLLYLAYRIKPELAQQYFPGLLLIPIFLTGFATVEAICINALEWYHSVLYRWNSAHTQGIMSFSPSSTPTQAFWSFAPITLFLASFIVLYFAYRFDAEYGGPFTVEEKEHLQGVIDEGVWILPKNVPTGNSYNIFLDLMLSEHFAKGQYLFDKSSDYLEAEIQAVGLEVDGKKRMKMETSPLAVNTWNYRFPESGTHTINLMIHLVKPSDNSGRLIFTYVHNVNVSVSRFWSVLLVPALTLAVPILAAVVQAVLR